MLKSVFKRDRTAFIPFIMAGHPSIEETRQAIVALSSAGADLIELGVPFSDPVADGPINQRAADVALQQGVHLGDILALVRSLRDRGCHTPIILFSYVNPILAFGCDAFATAAKTAGVNGVLLVDLPPEEGEAFYGKLQSAGLDVVLLVSPTTNPARFDVYHRVNPAFIYYISRLAVTGVQNDLAPQLAIEVEGLRAHFPMTPIAIGFGISTVDQARTVAEFADGVVIGSVLVNALEQEGVERLEIMASQFADVVHDV